MKSPILVHLAHYAAVSMAMALCALILTANSAVAQGFMVKPMRMEVTVAPGRTVSIPLEIRNTEGLEGRDIDVRLAEISQNPDGSWKLIEPGTEGQQAVEYSARPWATLSDDNLRIAPLEPAEVMVQLKPPANAQGAYFMAVIAETRAPEASQGVSVRMRFAIPVIIEIEGRPARQQVSLADSIMTYVASDGSSPATTTAALRVENKGRTYSRVKGYLTIERKTEDRWRPITRLDIPERAILPGLTLELGDDLERRLGPGSYRLRGDLSVDGRRVPPVERELEFVGDPDADMTAFDTALILSPAMVEVGIVPGATRTTILRIENPGTDPVKVDLSATTPPTLGGVSMGDLLGVQLSAEPWTEIVPAQFTIRPGTKQNVRVMSRIPKDGISHANYYGDLVVKGTYEDGQSAGETRSRIHLSYSAVPNAPKAIVEQVSLSEGEKPTLFFAQARLTNIGNVHIEPFVKLYMLTSQGSQLKSINMTSEEGSLLPLGKRTFGADLDLDGTEPGYYALRAVANIGSGTGVFGQQVIQVTAEKSEGGETTTRVNLVDSASADLPPELLGSAPPATDAPADEGADSVNQ